MASITIRNLDERTKARLRVRAAQHGRSMEEEARTESFDCRAVSPFGSRRGPVDEHLDSSIVVDCGARPATSLYTTSITQAEMLHSIMLLPPGKRRRALELAATAMFTEDFGGRILGFDADAAPSYARIASDRRRAGRPIAHFDAQIAAIARATGAVLATRNLGDFADCGVSLVDPWRP